MFVRRLSSARNSLVSVVRLVVVVQCKQPLKDIRVVRNFWVVERGQYTIHMEYLVTWVQANKLNKTHPQRFWFINVKCFATLRMKIIFVGCYYDAKRNRKRKREREKEREIDGNVVHTHTLTHTEGESERRGELEWAWTAMWFVILASTNRCWICT